MSEPQIRVILVDDHPVVLEGLRSYIGNAADVTLVGETMSGSRAVHLARETKPDIAIVDISLRDLSGITVVEKIAEATPKTLTIILSAHEDRAYLRRALEAGAKGYVLKRSANENVLHAIRAVMAGGVYVDPVIAGSVLPQRSRSAAASGGHSQRPGVLELTTREEEVARLLALGHPNKEIAGLLGVTIKSIETYKVRAYDKLGITSRTQLIRHAVAQGWLSQL